VILANAMCRRDSIWSMHSGHYLSLWSAGAPNQQSTARRSGLPCFGFGVSSGGVGTCLVAAGIPTFVAISVLILTRGLSRQPFGISPPPPRRNYEWAASGVLLSQVILEYYLSGTPTFYRRTPGGFPVGFMMIFLHTLGAVE
jgi:hypothetical protein